ncbi:MAG: methyltransferase domain-containing protein [Lachnospiraceae bacterium]|nr:methyltransferase domain-containing protein [Lachnospiraceae bacterium]
MDYSRKISERLWNMPDKGELESHREETFIDDIIQKSHIEKELLSHLDGIKTVFDGGAGCGRFSILLAKHGCEVTHFDISQPMIEKAKELAEKEGVPWCITYTFMPDELEEILKRYGVKNIKLAGPVACCQGLFHHVYKVFTIFCRKWPGTCYSSRPVCVVTHFPSPDGLPHEVTA